MNINKIDNGCQVKFNALKRISCSTGVLIRSFNEECLVQELNKIVKTDKFFEKNDVKAYIQALKGIASIKLSYKPTANSFKEKLRNLFRIAKTIEMSERRNCTDDATYLLAKRVRKITSFEKLA